ncbi:MAG: hypothetical protein HC803_06290 [Saprospiraceae bacterium]|nr:hypothetical protein [Saprospiraceae bacterium]
MIIANPIYDVVFKRLMENERVAKFFIGTLLNETIESVEMKPQEFTYIDKLAGLSVFRLDFIAVIRTETGETKKVLIEIQKAKSQIDLMRFRNYLAEQYKKKELVDNEKVALPITTIYILGFNLPEIESACIFVERQYRDLINQITLTQKSDFVEKLTHDSYVVQVNRITDRYQSRLDQLLSVFEQSNFIDDNKVVKEFKHSTETEDVKIITDILHHSGTNPTERKELEAEQEAWRTVNAMFEDKEKAFQKALKKQQAELAEKNKAISEKNKAINEKDKAISEKDKLIEELLKKLKDKK